MSDWQDKRSFGNDVAAALKIIRNEKKVYKDYVPKEAISAGVKMFKSTQELWKGLQKSVAQLVIDEIPYEYPHVTVWWYSVLIAVIKDPIIFQEFFRYVRKHKDVFSANTQYFLYNQLHAMLFRFQELNIQEVKAEMWQFRMEIVEEFAKQMKTPLELIPFYERTRQQVLVITEQFLSVKHGPTKTALDRCKTIMTKMGKEVLLINSAEAESQVGVIPFCEMLIGSYNAEKRSEKGQYWEGVTVPYYQCENNMPDVETIDQLLQEIRSMAPIYVITIGSGGILGDLTSRIIPTLAVGLTPSDLEYTCAQYQTLGRKLQEQDIEMLKSVGYTERHVIESIFTSGLKPQTEHITRADLGISEHVFLIVVVGYRLEDEVTDEFLEMLGGIMQKDMYVGFLGKFDGYEERIKNHPRIFEHEEKVSYLGFCEDILSRIEICDLYVNPIRRGGGTSCVKAMSKGVPVVTVDYGDVSVNAGEEFCVKDYDKMQRRILQYYSDKEYYNAMSEKALKRAAVLLDTETEFLKVIQEMNEREQMCERQEKEICRSSVR